MIENLEKLKECIDLELEKNRQILKDQMLYLMANPNEDTGIAQFYNGAMVALFKVKNKIKELEN